MPPEANGSHPDRPGPEPDPPPPAADLAAAADQIAHEVVEVTEHLVDEAIEVAEQAVDATIDASISGIERFDIAVDGVFDRLRGNAAVDRAFYTASALADFSLLWHLLGAARGVASDRNAHHAVRLSLALAAESALVNVAIKSVVKRERPVPHFDRPHHLRMPVTTSFPSGHASAAFCAAALLSDGHPRGRPLYYALATVVAASRVHVKIHHASDVIVGAAVGTVLAAAIRRVWPAR